MNSISTNRCSVFFVRGFPFRPSRNDNEMVTQISLKWKGKLIKQQRKKKCGRFEEYNYLFCSPLVSKFMSYLSKKKIMIIKK